MKSPRASAQRARRRRRWAQVWTGKQTPQQPKPAGG